MRKMLEDFYYGNIVPCERQTAPNSELEKATDRVARYESQLTEQLNETEQTILAKLIRSQTRLTASQLSRISSWVSDWEFG